MTKSLQSTFTHGKTVEYFLFQYFNAKK